MIDKYENFNGKIKITVENVTPEMARAYLLRNKSNRSLRLGTVKKYAEDMKAGRWQMTHQGLAFSKYGDLLDGQHRLNAVVVSNVTVPMVVVWGVEADSALGLQVDVGLNRSAADVLNAPRQIVDPCAFIHQLNEGKVGSRASIAKYFFAFRHDVQKIVGESTAKKRGITAAPIVAAAAILDAMRCSDYAKNAYKRLIKLDFDAMTPIEHAWIRNIHSNNVEVTRKLETFAKALSLFSQENANTTKIYASEKRVDEARAHIKQRLTEASEAENLA